MAHSAALARASAQVPGGEGGLTGPNAELTVPCPGARAVLRIDVSRRSGGLPTPTPLSLLGARVVGMSVMVATLLAVLGVERACLAGGVAVRLERLSYEPFRLSSVQVDRPSPAFRYPRGESMSQLVKNRIGGIFVPVRDVAKARDWYRGLLGLSVDDEPLDGHHLCVIPMEGDRNLLLDEMPMWGGDQPDGPPTYQTPAFMFDTDDVYAAHTHVRNYGADVVTDVHEFGKDGWFAFRDLDGNLLMVCGNNQRAR